MIVRLGPASRRRAFLVTAAAAVVLALLFVGSGRAEAHALLVRSDPPINAMLRESPPAVNLFMSEPLQREFSGVQVLDSQGQRVDRGGVRFNPQNRANMSVRLPQLDAGNYTVAWRTLSEVDGHTWNGSFSFTVLNPDGSAPDGATFRPDLSLPGPPAAADAAAKWFGFAAMMALVGGGLFALVAGLPAARAADAQGGLFARVTVDRGRNLAVAGVGLLLLTTAYETGSSALRLGGLEFLDEALFDSRHGFWLIVRWSLLIAATGLLLVTARRPMPGSALTALAVLGVGIIASFSGISHGAALDRGSIWATLFDAGHLAAVTVWVGMLGAMTWTLWSTRALGERGARRTFQIEAVRRFSLVAAGIVPIVITAGVFSTLVEVPVWRGFSDTDWGIAMLVKFGLLALLFAVAGTNAIVLRPRSEQAAVGASDDSRLERRFHRLMRLELGLMLAVLAATAALTQLPSARNELPSVVSAPQNDRAIEEQVILDDLVATLSIEPNLVGLNRYEVSLREAGGSPPVDPVIAVRLHFTFEDPEVGPLIVSAERERDDRFTLEGAFFGLAGEWSVAVEVDRQASDDVINSVSTTVEKRFTSVLPFGQASPGPLALPITQFDWNGVIIIWAAVAAGLLIAFRGPLWRGVSVDAAYAALFGAVALMFATFVLLWSVGGAPGRTQQNPVGRTPLSVDIGATLFAANCVQCHGVEGLGDGPLAGTLTVPPATFRVHVPFHPDGVLFAWISDGIPGTGMPAWKGRLSEQDRWDLVNFLRESFDLPAEND